MPRIGLLSDSHSRAGITRRAVKLLIDQGAEILLHLGDICSEDVIDALLVPAPVVSRLVLGNNDDIVPMTRYALNLGLLVDHPVGRLDLGEGKSLVYLHGDDFSAMDRAIREGVTYLCHGHTHRAADARTGPTRVINPGALCRAKVYSVALLDTETDKIVFSSLADGDRL